MLEYKQYNCVYRTEKQYLATQDLLLTINKFNIYRFYHMNIDAHYTHSEIVYALIQAIVKV